MDKIAIFTGKGREKLILILGHLSIGCLYFGGITTMTSTLELNLTLNSKLTLTAAMKVLCLLASLSFIDFSEVFWVRSSHCSAMLSRRF